MHALAAEELVSGRAKLDFKEHGHQTSCGTSSQTAKNDFTAREAKGLLTRGKVEKAFVYSPAPDPAARLGLL